MFKNADQITAKSKSFFEAQIATINSLAAIAVQGTEKIVALNLALAKAAPADFTAATKELFTAKDPQAFFALASALAKPNAEKVAAYGRHLTDILSATKAEFTKVADEQVAQVQSNVSALVDGIEKNAPAGSEKVVEMLKSSVASANEGYEKLNKTTKQAVEDTEAQIAKASDEFTQVAKKVAAK